MSENWVIGDHNQLPWHLPADLKHFKTLTTGHPIVMGRKTYESIGRPLPNRTNIIMTRKQGLHFPGCQVVNSLEAAIQCAVAERSEEIFIIGGAEIYKQCLPYTRRIYLTLVHGVVKGDTFFPELNLNEWEEIERSYHAADENHAFAYSFIQLEKK
jgi:dihydrofolate reductase